MLAFLPVGTCGSFCENWSCFYILQKKFYHFYYTWKIEKSSKISQQKTFWYFFNLLDQPKLWIIVLQSMKWYLFFLYCKIRALFSNGYKISWKYLLIEKADFLSLSRVYEEISSCQESIKYMWCCLSTKIKDYGFKKNTFNPCQKDS